MSPQVANQAVPSLGQQPAPQVMTRQHVAWAKEHDWFLDAWLNWDGNWSVLTWHEVEREQTREHRDYRALREWAGY